MKYKVTRTDGTAIPDDEPCFVIRAKDVLAVPMIQLYRDAAVNMNLPAEFVENIEVHLGRIIVWQQLNRYEVKIPD